MAPQTTGSSDESMKKTLWEKMKDEKQRNDSKVQHVTHKEAENLTGHGEGDAAKTKEKNGVPSLTSVLF